MMIKVLLTGDSWGIKKNTWQTIEISSCKIPGDAMYFVDVPGYEMELDQRPVENSKQNGTAEFLLKYSKIILEK